MLIEDIKKLIAKDKTDQVLRELMDADLDEEMKHSVLLLSARWNSIRKDNMNGILSGDEWIRSKSIINHSLLQLLDDLSKETDTEVKKGSDTGSKFKQSRKLIYGKINHMDVDGSGNIILQDVNGSTVTINYNDSEKLTTLLKTLTETQSFELKQLFGHHHKEVLAKIREIQEQIDQKNTINKTKTTVESLDDFFRELSSLKIESAKNRLLNNYKLLREYEEMLILEDDPKRKMKYNKEVEMIKSYITKDEAELKNIAKTK